MNRGQRSFGWCPQVAVTLVVGASLAACGKSPSSPESPPPVAVAAQQPTPATHVAPPAAATPTVSLPEAPTSGQLGGWRADLTPSERQAATVGRAEFFRVYTAADGLGPHFNDASCAACHNLPTEGGSSDMAHAARLWFEPPERVHAFERNTLPGYEPLQAPPGAPVSLRKPPPLYGAHLLQGIPDATIRAGCDPDDRNGDHIRGHVNTAYNGHVGRFGWKAHTDTILDFVADAFAGEMGITNRIQRDPDHMKDADKVPDPDLADALVTAVAAYVDALAPPARTGQHPVGEALFATTGCVNCHRPETAPGVPAFTDLCVHDLGTAFSDGVQDIQAKPSEWRTSPLWGLSRRTLYFHDGRTTDLETAIRSHGGEAEATIRRFSELDAKQRADLLAFLGTL